MNRDPELPNGFQDADFDMVELTRAGNAAHEAKKRGDCAHGWRQGSTPDNGIPQGHAKCLDCGITATIETLDADYDRIINY